MSSTGQWYSQYGLALPTTDTPTSHEPITRSLGDILVHHIHADAWNTMHPIIGIQIHFMTHLMKVSEQFSQIQPACTYSRVLEDWWDDDDGTLANHKYEYKVMTDENTDKVTQILNLHVVPCYGDMQKEGKAENPTGLISQQLTSDVDILQHLSGLLNIKTMDELEDRLDNMLFRFSTVRRTWCFPQEDGWIMELQLESARIEPHIHHELATLSLRHVDPTKLISQQDVTSYVSQGGAHLNQPIDIDPMPAYPPLVIALSLPTFELPFASFFPRLPKIQQPMIPRSSAMYKLYLDQQATDGDCETEIHHGKTWCMLANDTASSS